MEVREDPQVGKACTTMPLSPPFHLALVAVAVASSTRTTIVNVKAPRSPPPDLAPPPSMRPRARRTPASLAQTIAVAVEPTTSDTSRTAAVADRNCKQDPVRRHGQAEKDHPLVLGDVVRFMEDDERRQHLELWQRVIESQLGGSLSLSAPVSAHISRDLALTASAL